MPPTFCRRGSGSTGSGSSRLLASGGCGRVYLADQVAMERQVAIKILKQSLADQEDAAERFINEARNAAKFQYPNIVTTLEAGKVNGLYYIAMQYVNGETVEKQLDDGKIFSESEALSIVIKIAGALQLIWNKHRMFHKDIKPANIMLDSDNEAMLLDMGIAQQAGEESLINGEVEGSPFYMSPEQIQGKTLTWSTDLYSLGATLYHMVTGCVPFYDKSIDQILEMHNNAPYPEPSERAPGSDISPELSGLMKRMLGKTPRKRFSSWEEFLQAASVIYEERQAEEQAFLHPPIKLTPVITASQPLPGRPMKKHWVLLFYGFSLILFVLILAALFIWHNNRLAAQALENCRFDPYTTNPQEYKKALDQVYLTAQKFGVRARIRREVDDAYARLKQFENEFLTLQAKVNQALNRAEKLKAQAQKETALGKKLVEQKHSDDNHYTRARKLLNQAAIHLNGITTKTRVCNLSSTSESNSMKKKSRRSKHWRRNATPMLPGSEKSVRRGLRNRSAGRRKRHASGNRRNSGKNSLPKKTEKSRQRSNLIRNGSKNIKMNSGPLSWRRS